MTLATVLESGMISNVSVKPPSPLFLRVGLSIDTVGRLLKQK